MTPGSAPYADGDFVGSPDDRPPQDPIDGPNPAGPIEHLAPVVPIRAAREAAGKVPRPASLRKLPSDDQWKATMRALDAAVGYLADPDIYQLIEAARSVRRQDAVEWLSAEQARRVRQGPKGMDVAPAAPGGSGGRASGISDPTGNAAVTEVANPDAEVWALLLVVDRAAALIINARSRLSRLAYRRGDIEARERRLGEQAHERVGQGTCEACGDWCSGAANDRLRSGFDDKCRKRWERYGRPDRGMFVAQVRTEIVAQADEAAREEEIRGDNRTLRLIEGGGTEWDPERHLAAAQDREGRGKVA